MSEPLTDEEFEKIKLLRKNKGVQSLTGDIDSLIATVDSLKAQTDWVRVAIQANKVIKKEREKWLKENAKLKAALEAALKRIEEIE